MVYEGQSTAREQFHNLLVAKGMKRIILDDDTCDEGEEALSWAADRHESFYVVELELDDGTMYFFSYRNFTPADIEELQDFYREQVMYEDEDEDEDEEEE